jgi:hypothetical protein
MGKYVLLVALSVVSVWGFSMAQMQSDRQSADDEAKYQETVLARQTARTGLNTVLAKARDEAEDKCASGIVDGVDTMSGTYESGEYDHGTYKAWLEEEPDVDFGYRAYAEGEFEEEGVQIDRLIRRAETREGLVYADGGNNGELRKTTPTGSEEFGSPPQIKAAGSAAADLDGDGNDEVPYVRKSNRKLGMIDENEETQTLVPGDAEDAAPAENKTRLGTGTWGSSERSVFYANADHETIYRVTWDGDTNAPTTPEEIVSPSDGAQAMLGIDDIDGDDDDELVFADASQAVRYLEEPGGNVVKLDNGGTGSDQGIGSGGLVDFNGDGTVSAVFINGSNNLRIVNADGTDRTITLDDGSDDGAAKAPPVVKDLDGDGEREVAYLREEDDGGPDVEYVDADGTGIRTLCGISVEKGAGRYSMR